MLLYKNKASVHGQVNGETVWSIHATGNYLALKGNELTRAGT